MKISLIDFFPKLTQATFLLVVFFLPTQLGKHFWPEFSMVSGLRIDYLSPTIYFTDVLIVLLLIAWLLSKFSIYHLSSVIYFQFSNFKIGQFLNRWKMKHGKWKMILFILFLLIGIIFSTSPQAGFFGLLKILEFLVFGVVAVKLLKDKKFFGQTVFVYASAILVQSGLAIAQFIHQGSVGGLFYYLGERTFTSLTPGIANASLGGVLTLRPYGTLPHPNVLAGYLLIGIILVISSSKAQGTRLKQLFFFTAITLGSIAFILTMSRSAALVAGFILIITLVTHLRNTNNISSLFLSAEKVKVLIASVTLLVSIIPFIVLVAMRFSSFSFTSEEYIFRRDLTIISLKMFMDNPLWGVGLNNFLIRLPDYIELYRIPIQPVHNIYLLILSETGIVGFATATFCAYLLLNKTIKSLSAGNKLPFLLLLTIFLLGLNDHFLLTLQQGRLLLVLVFSLIYAQGNNTFDIRAGKFNRNIISLKTHQ